LFTKQLQTSLIDAEFDEKADNDLDCAASEVKMEDRFELSVKFYTSKRSLELSNAV